MLIYIVRFNKEVLNITIHNRYPGLELASSAYFSKNTVCHVSPNQQIGTGAIVEASFEAVSMRENFEGALLYKLQRKYATKTDNWPNYSTTFIKDTTTSTYLLVAWRIGDYYHTFPVCLIECIDDFIWNEDMLWVLYKECSLTFQMHYKSGISTWLMNDGTVLKTRRSITYGSDCKLDIVISDGIWEYDMEEPIEIDPERLVLSLLMLIVLMYVVRLYVQPALKLIIHNQCSNIDLVSPKYVANGRLECHKPPNSKVCAGETMRSGFIIGKPKSASRSVLIYRLQRRQSHDSTEMGEDTSVHLLVVWRISSSNELFADARLIEHDKKLDWDEKGLRKLYSKNTHLKLSFYSAAQPWLLDDNTVLMVTFKIMNGGRLLDITISEEERDKCGSVPVQIPLWIDAKR
jgi:hypothetical protein